jgi:hypothetical protein
MPKAGKRFGNWLSKEQARELVMLSHPADAGDLSAAPFAV